MRAGVETAEEIVARCREVVEDLSFQTVREWKAQHPKARVVGCYPVYSPVELIHAAGILPVGIFGGGNQIEIAHADARFQSFVCSIVKSTLELGLTGRLDFLDGILFHSICDPARNLASVFQRNFPSLHVDYIHFPQNLASPLAEVYLTQEYRRVLRGLEKIGGQPVTEEALVQAISTMNRWRSLVRELYTLRALQPHLLPAAELYPVIRAGTVLPVQEHIRLLEIFLEGVRRREGKPKDRIRVLVEGSFCEQPPIDLIACLEEAGCYVLDDDFLLGWRWFLEDVPIDGDPVQALARAYIHRSVYSPTKHDLRRRKSDHLLEKVRTLGADAVVVLIPKFCEPALFDYPLYRRALEEARVPHLFVEYEEKMWIFDRVRTEVETFVESLLFD
ncbi:MAG: 2-hydroxyacyl-CoA dehydratase [Armatimonadota bacterium]|nr:2-hydroxyacyl-CoA dehydratase [Armatimonadota bacterium]